MIFMKNVILLSILLGCSACASIPTQAHLGFSDERRLVVVGENVREELALYYQKKYSALVWFTPHQGKMSTTATNFMESGLGLSRAMRVFIHELTSINETIGRWEIIIPKIAENYFLKALKNMPSRSLTKARGMIILIDSKGSPDIEAHVKRVTDGNFFVTYEFQQDMHL